MSYYEIFCLYSYPINIFNQIFINSTLFDLFINQKVEPQRIKPTGFDSIGLEPSIPTSGIVVELNEFSLAILFWFIWRLNQKVELTQWIFVSNTILFIWRLNQKVELTQWIFVSNTLLIYLKTKSKSWKMKMRGTLHEEKKY